MIEGRLVSSMPPPDDEIVIEPDPVIEAYKKDVDRTLLRENLKLTPAQRVEKLQRMAEDYERLREAGRHGHPGC
jgi:hypothetical protein